MLDTHSGIHEEMMDGIGALVEVNGLNFDINNHRHMVDTLLHGNSEFDDNVNQSKSNVNQRFKIMTHMKHIMMMYIHVILHCTN